MADDVLEDAATAHDDGHRPMPTADPQIAHLEPRTDRRDRAPPLLRALGDRHARDRHPGAVRHQQRRLAHARTSDVGEGRLTAVDEDRVGRRPVHREAVHGEPSALDRQSGTGGTGDLAVVQHALGVAVDEERVRALLPRRLHHQPGETRAGTLVHPDRPVPGPGDAHVGELRGGAVAYVDPASVDQRAIGHLGRGPRDVEGVPVVVGPGEDRPADPRGALALDRDHRLGEVAVAHRPLSGVPQQPAVLEAAADDLRSCAHDVDPSRRGEDTVHGPEPGALLRVQGRIVVRGTADADAVDLQMAAFVHVEDVGLIGRADGDRAGPFGGHHHHMAQHPDDLGLHIVARVHPQVQVRTRVTRVSDHLPQGGGRGGV